MANNHKETNLVVNTKVDQTTALANSGKVRIYDGAQPTNADDNITTQNLLAELTLGNPAFGAAVAGQATANAISGVTIALTGTAAWFRVLKSDGTTKLWDGSVGTSGCDMNLNSVALQAGAQFSITGWTYTQPKV
jgi:hypothetical protein